MRSSNFHKSQHSVRSSVLSQFEISPSLHSELFKSFAFKLLFQVFFALSSLPSSTMADPAAMRQALVRIGFTQQGSEAVVNDQGITSVAELGLLKESEIETLCKTVRRPGGTVPGAGDGAAPVANPGTAISLRAETNLKLASYFVKYRVKTSRDTTAADITLEAVRNISGLREWELNHKDVDPPENIINPKDWPKTMESIQEYLRGNLGVTGIPLAYVIRKNEEVTEDPADGWPTKQAEMIARAPIVEGPANARVYTATFNTDNQRVWELLSAITRDHDCWTYVKVGWRTRNGRQGYLGLYQHYLGPNAVDMMATAAERRLATTTYDGEKRRWNFDKYSGVHVECYHIITSLKEHGHAGIDDRSRVRYLNDGIKTSSLDAVKTRIMSDERLRSDFDMCVRLYKDMIHMQTANERKSLNVSATETQKKGGESKKKAGTITAEMVEDRYYEPKEYGKFTDEAKLKLKRMREARGQHPKKKQKTTPKLSKKDMRKIAAMVSELNVEEGNDDGSSSDEETQQTDNRSNRNLTRQSGARR